MSRTELVDFTRPMLLLERLGADPSFMTQGRRNDDIVNWFLACLLIRPGQSLQYYVDAFSEVLEDLSYVQVKDVDVWEIDWHDKLRMLFEHYGHLTDPVNITNLWIPVDYHVPDHSGGADAPLF